MRLKAFQEVPSKVSHCNQPSRTHFLNSTAPKCYHQHILLLCHKQQQQDLNESQAPRYSVLLQYNFMQKPQNQNPSSKENKIKSNYSTKEEWKYQWYQRGQTVRPARVLQSSLTGLLCVYPFILVLFLKAGLLLSTCPQYKCSGWQLRSHTWIWDADGGRGWRQNAVHATILVYDLRRFWLLSESEHSQ